MEPGDEQRPQPVCPKAHRRPLGWGAFNLVEGLVDHHVLGIHHVRDLPVHVPLYDWIFLSVGGVGLLVAGWRLSRCRPT